MNPALRSVHPPLRGKLWFANTLLAALLVGLLIAFVVMSFVVNSQPYDYYLLMRAADLFCFQPDQFAYGRALHIHYPAPFYSTFCVPYRVMEPVLRWLWMCAPVLVALWLVRGRAAVLAYPPLGVLLLIGQSSWLILPAFIVGALDREDRPVLVWQGFLVALGVFKPHIVFPVWVWLAWRWWRGRQWRALLAWGMTLVAIVLPSFMMRPTWLLEWLPNGRGFEPVNLASLAIIPVQLGGLEYSPGAGAMIGVVSFCLVMGVIIYGLLRWRRGRLALYDWVLLFCLVNPLLNDYDLLILLPFIAGRRRRLLLALTAGLLTWLFAMMSKVTSPHARFSMSLLITLSLLVLRLWRRDAAERLPPAT